MLLVIRDRWLLVLLSWRQLSSWTLSSGISRGYYQTPWTTQAPRMFLHYNTIPTQKSTLSEPSIIYSFWVYWHRTQQSSSNGISRDSRSFFGRLWGTQLIWWGWTVRVPQNSTSPYWVWWCPSLDLGIHQQSWPRWVGLTHGEPSLRIFGCSEFRLCRDSQYPQSWGHSHHTSPINPRVVLSQPKSQPHFGRNSYGTVHNPSRGTPPINWRHNNYRFRVDLSIGSSLVHQLILICRMMRRWI